MVHIVVREKIKELSQGMSVSREYGEELDAVVEQIIKRSVQRAKANARSTIMPRDL